MKAFTKTYTALKWLFGINIIIIAGITLYMLQIKGPDFGLETQNGVIFERYAIILTLIAIPAALKLFSVMTGKLQDLPKQEKNKKYISYYILRIIILDMAAAVNIIGFYLYESTNFVYLAVIVMFALCFTFPGKAYNMLKIENKQSENKEEE